MKKAGTLLLSSLISVIGCNCWTPREERAATVLVLEPESRVTTRSLLPDEELVSDINLLIYNAEGLLEERRYITGEQLVDGSRP